MLRLFGKITLALGHTPPIEEINMIKALVMLVVAGAMLAVKWFNDKIDRLFNDKFEGW